MAWTKSGLYGLAFRDALDTTNLGVDFLLTTHKIALYNNTETPAFQTETAYSTTNEVTGGSYTAGGYDLAGLSPTFAVAGATAVLTYDMNDWVTPAISVTAYGAKEYADALGTNDVLVGVWFNGAFTSTAGTFTIQWAAGGVFTITLAP